MFNESELFTLITICSLAFLVTVNIKLKNLNFLFTINFIFLAESVVLSFFFDKFPLFHSLLLLAVSLFYFTKLSASRGFVFLSDKESLGPVFPSYLVRFFRPSGIAMVVFVIIYEYFSDRSFSSTDLLVILFSCLLIFYYEIPQKYIKERDFMIVFMFLLSFLIILPNILYKIRYGFVGTKSEGGWFDDEIIVYNFLGRPLANLLSVFGFNILASGHSIFFEDLNAGIFRQVLIAESCSGIISIQIFMAALFSFLWIEYRAFNNNFIVLFLLGSFISYVANLLRMATIVLTGHYWGMDAFDWAHKSIGWIIFTFWIFLFWLLMDKFFNVAVVNAKKGWE